jgi:DNA-binding beta-propeller fold protein YncE
MLFLVCAFLSDARGLAASFRPLIKPKTAFFVFWILFFVVSHLWNFRTAPWNGDSLFDESANDLRYLKSHIIGHPYQAAWFHGIISRETLFHYYVWGFLKLLGFNILSYEAALFVIWLTVFVFTLLLVDLFFESYVVTSVTAVILNFLPFAFIYTFVGYRYPMTAALAVISLYFLHLGFRTHLMNTERCSHGAARRSGSPVPDESNAPQGPGYNISETAGRSRSRLYLSLGGIAAGLCLASSIPGKQYVLALTIAAPLYAVFYWKNLKRTAAWSSLAVFVYSFLAAATPILCYIIFNRDHYTSYEGAYLHQFWNAVRGAPAPNDVRYYVTGLWNCFFAAHFWPRLLFPDFLPIPLPYYWLLLPGFVLALWEKRFEVVPLATLPVVGVFVTGGAAVEQRLLLAIPFWIILISFTVAWLLKLRPWPGVQIVFGALAGLILLDGLLPSIRYIYAKTKSPFSIHHYAQHQVAVSRFLKHVVVGQQHPGPPHLERDEFSRIKGIPDPPYDTFICQNDAYSIIHLFLHDYDADKILSFCADLPFFSVMTEQDVWNANKKAIASYAPTNKDLKLIWERDPETERIIRRFQSLREIGTEDSISFSFGGRTRTFYVLNIPNSNIRQFQKRVKALPARPNTPPAPFGSLGEGVASMFEGGKGTEDGEFDSPTGIAVDGNGNVFVADTGNGRIEKFSSTGAFLSTIGTTGSGRGQFAQPNGIAIDRAGNIYVAEAGNHRVQKLAPDGTFIAEWKGPELGFYGPRRIAICQDDSIYVVDQGHNRIVKFGPDGEVLASWGSKGGGAGEFNDPTSVVVDPATNKVYVADPCNKRIQVFDSNGKFLAKWSVPQWGQPVGFEDLSIDSRTGRLYASSTHVDAVLIFDLNGTSVGTLIPKPPDKLEGPSALALVNRKLYVLNMGGNRVSIIDLQTAAEMKHRRTTTSQRVQFCRTDA